MQDTAVARLPVIQRPIDNTAQSAYMACPREYLFGMLLHRRSRGKSPPLVFGAAWHDGLAAHYRTGGDREAVHDAIAAGWEGHDADSDYRTLPRVFLEYDRYLKKWGPVEEDRGDTVGYPDNPMVEISTEIGGGGLNHPLSGKIDRVIELDGLHYIEDHKTTSRFDKHFWSQFTLSNQMMGYVKMGQLLFPSLNIVGVRVNVAHVLTNKSDFYRQLFTYTRQRLDEWTDNRNRWMERIAYSTEHDDFPGHYGDNGCSRKFGMCQYHEVCSLPERFRQAALERDFDVAPWNPLEADDADNTG